MSSTAEQVLEISDNEVARSDLVRTPAHDAEPALAAKLVAASAPTSARRPASAKTAPAPPDHRGAVTEQGRPPRRGLVSSPRPTPPIPPRNSRD